MPEREYRRLTRSKSRSFLGVVSISRSSLWLGRDHLLCIDTNGYTETYKRFYFRDIQAVLLRQTMVWIFLALALAAAASLFGAIAWFGGVANGVPEVAWIFGVAAALLALGTVLSLAAGPTCKCYLRTAVQVEHLPSMNRLRRARKVLTRLRPLLAEAQGQLAPEEIALRLRELQSAPP